MNLEDIHLLFEFNSWANHRTLASCAHLSSEEFTRDMGSSFRSVRDTLVHIFSGEWVWVERWLGRTPVAFPAAPDFSDFASVERRWSEIERELRSYIASLHPSDLDRALKYKTMAGLPMEGPRSLMLQHLVNHSTYHRGQIATLLRQLGATPHSTDLIQFHRERATLGPS